MAKGFAAIIALFVGITISVVMVANVVLPTVFGANKTGWDTGTTAMWTIVGISVVALMILLMYRGG
jgi:hypothetical protein